MATPLKQWIRREVRKFEKKSLEEQSNYQFFRDPPRPHLVNQEYFFSPADGIILYQEEVKDDTSFLEVKGEEYTLPDILQQPDYDKYPCLVVGVFMTFADVHVNRVPYSGSLRFKPLPTIESRNLPMLAVEKHLFNGMKKIQQWEKGDLDYLKRNERMHNTFYNPRLDYEYYVVQIGDVDVSVITHYTTDQASYFTQNERFSFIRWGSQVDVVLPLDKRFDLEFVQNTTDHVEAGLDPLIKIVPKKGRKFIL
jgi:phosphatidylserine decarboxylase